MYWCCDVCDKVIYENFANNHLRSGYHKHLPDSIIRRYIITNPEPNKIDDTIRKSLRLHYRKNEKFLVILSTKYYCYRIKLKILEDNTHVIVLKGVLILHFSLKKIRIIKEQLYSQILELRITFVSRFENITFDHFFTKTKSVLEWKLLAMLDKNPENVPSFDYKHHSRPLF